MTFSVRHFPREIPVRTLRPYFESKNATVPPEWWKHKVPKLASELTDLLISGTDQIGEAILGELVRVHPMASERGRNALLNAAAHRTDIVTRFGELENDEERALWMLLEHGDIFREGEELRFFDYYSEGSRGRHYKTTANLTVSQAEADVSAFKVEVCQFHRRRDGSGVSCEVEFAERHQDKSIQIAVYIQGLPNNGTEFVNGKFVRRVSNPGLEAAIVYVVRIGRTRFGPYACELFFGRRLFESSRFDGAKQTISHFIGKAPAILLTTTSADLIPGEPPARCAIMHWKMCCASQSLKSRSMKGRSTRRFAEPITGLVQTGSDSFSARAIDRLWWGIRNTCLPTSRHLPSRLLITLGAAVFRGFIRMKSRARPILASVSGSCLPGIPLMESNTIAWATTGSHFSGDRHQTVFEFWRFRTDLHTLAPPKIPRASGYSSHVYDMLGVVMMDLQHFNQVQLARRWSMSPRTLERWRWLGQGPQYLKIGGRVVYRLTDIEAYEAAQLHESTSHPLRAE